MTRSDAPGRRGAPLILLGAVIAGWIAMRALVWDVPFERRGPDREVEARYSRADPIADPAAEPPVVRQPPAATGPIFAGSSGLQMLRAEGLARTPIAHPAPTRAPAQESEDETIVGRYRGEEPAEDEPPGSVQSPGPASHGRALFSAPISIDPARSGRWHVDGWATYRTAEGPSAIVVGGPDAPAYGKSQAGLLLRRDLGTGPLRPQGYFRATYAPDRPSQGDLALGLSARPFAAVPVRVQGEARATRTQQRTELRPAVIAVSEFPVVQFPLGIEAEAYAQAGWVGGRYATKFVDGQARAERQVATLGMTRLRAGAGVWGGAQKFASRLDAGPTATLDLRETDVPVRVAIDYRIKLAGTASPGDGLAITLSTGF